MKMKKIIITSVTLCLIVTVGTTLSKKSPSGRAVEDHAEADRKSLQQDGELDDGLRQRMQGETAERPAPETSKVEERLARQQEDFERNLYGRPGRVFSRAPFYYSREGQTIPQVEDPNLLKILTEMHFANQHNLQRIQALEGKVRLLEERLAKLEANEKKNFYQRKRLGNQLKSLQEKRY